MIVKDIFADICLGLAAALVVGSSIGILVMRDVYQKLHYITPAALVAPLLVAIAVLIHQGYYENTTETWLALFFVSISGPFVTHAILRAAHFRETGDWRPGQSGKRDGAGEGNE